MSGGGGGWEEAGPLLLSALFDQLVGVQVVETGKQFSQITLNGSGTRTGEAWIPLKSCDLKIFKSSLLLCK